MAAVSCAGSNPMCPARGADDWGGGEGRADRQEATQRLPRQVRARGRPPCAVGARALGGRAGRQVSTVRHQRIPLWRWGWPSDLRTIVIVHLVVYCRQRQRGVQEMTGRKSMHAFPCVRALLTFELSDSGSLWVAGQTLDDRVPPSFSAFPNLVTCPLPTTRAHSVRMTAEARTEVSAPLVFCWPLECQGSTEPPLQQVLRLVQTASPA